MRFKMQNPKIEKIKKNMRQASIRIQFMDVVKLSDVIMILDAFKNRRL